VNVTLVPPDAPRLLFDASVKPPKIIIRKNRWGRLFINRTCATDGLSFRTCPVSDEE